MEQVREAEILAATADGLVLDCADGRARRPVDAAVLRRCCHQLKDQVDPHGLRLRNASIVGSLDLAGLTVAFPLRFSDCEFDSPLIAEGADLYELSLTDCPEVPGLVANGVTIRRDLELSGSHVSESPVTGLALDLADAVINGSVFLVSAAGGRNLVVHGGIDLGRARIGSRFLIRDATLTAPRGTVLAAPRLSVRGELTLEGSCRVTGGLDLSMSELSSLTIGAGCELRSPGGTALNLTNAELLSSLAVARTVAVQGTIRLAGAHIHGALELRGTILSHPERKAILTALGATIDGDVDLRDVRATGGRIRFANATIGTLLASGAHLINENSFTLTLHQATVNGSVVLNNGFISEGPIILDRATIEGRLQCDGGTFVRQATNPIWIDQALQAISTTIRGGTHLDWAKVTPSVDFTNAVTPFLIDNPANWPPSFVISGFSYERFGDPRTSTPAPWDHAARCKWLRHQLAYDAGPYEQAARVFRQHGYLDGAKTILIAKNQHARDAITGRWAAIRRALSTIYDLTVGYGYRPARVLWLLATLLVLITISLQVPVMQATMRAASMTGTIYTTRGPVTKADITRPEPMTDACGNGSVRCFNSLLYAVDTVVPLVSLDQRSTWYPDAHAPYGTLMQWWLNTATVLGWLLSSIFVLALAGLARSL